MKTELETLIEAGRNHTGVMLHPEYATQMLEGTSEFGPTSSGGPEALADNRIRVAKMSTPVATMPQMEEVPAETIRLLDKLGARLQFERMGVRLYDALISKLDAYGELADGPTRAELLEIRNDELEHLTLAHTMIVKLGGDPTVVTPCANLQAIASRGIGDVLVDPRTTLIQCLDAIVVAEMTDHDSWYVLSALIAQVEPSFEDEVRRAEQTEARHLAMVRGWIAAAELVTVALH